MPYKLEIEIPDEAISALRADPDELAEEIRLAAAIKWYELEHLSQGKAAEFAGLSRRAFIEALNRYEVSVFQTKPEDLEGDVKSALGSGNSAHLDADE